MNVLKHYELVTYFVPLLGSLSGARKSCFQFWQTSNSPPLRSLIITIPIIVTTPSTGVPQISNWPTPDAFKLPFKYFPCKFKLRNIPRILQLLYSGGGWNRFTGDHPIPHFICWTGPWKEVLEDIWYKYVVVGGGGGSPLVWSPPLVFQPPAPGGGGEVLLEKGGSHSPKTNGSKLTFEKS